MTTDLGANWNEVAGDWGTLNSELVEDFSTGNSNSANALVITTQAVPARSAGQMYVQIDVPVEHTTVGDIYRIYPCCLTSSSVGNVLVEFEYISTNTWEVRITPSSGAESTATSNWGGDTNTDYHTLHVCTDRVEEGGNFSWGIVRAGTKPAVNELVAWSETDPGEGRYAGIGHDVPSVKLVILDNFEMGELRTATIVCRACFCMCSEAPPIPMLPVLTGQFLYTNEDSTRTRAVCLQGLSWEMRYDAGPTIVEWVGTFTLTRDGVTETIDFRLVCMGDGRFQLITSDPCISGTGNDINIPTGYGAHYSTCDPIAIVFGPYVLDFANANCRLCQDPNGPEGCIGPNIPPFAPGCYGDFYIVFTQ